MEKNTRQQDDQLLRRYTEAFRIAREALDAMKSVKPASGGEPTAAFELAVRHYRQCRVRCAELYAMLPSRFHDRVPEPPDLPEVMSKKETADI